MRLLLNSVLTACLLASQGNALSPSSSSSKSVTQHPQYSSRRAWLGQQGAIVAAASVLTGSAAISGAAAPVSAAGSTPSPAELEKLRKGHARVKYLLENWNTETEICGKVVMSDMERKQIVRTEGTCGKGRNSDNLNVRGY